MWSQKLRVAAVAFAGMATCCMTVSVVVLPKPSSHASKVPECGGSELELLMISNGECVDMSVHGEGLEAPFSNPPLPINSVVVEEFETVTVTVAEVPTLPAASDAFDTMVCAPFVKLVVTKLKEIEVEFVLLATTLPSIRSCICVTPTLSEAVAVTVTVPDTVAPFAGAVTDVVGGVVSAPGVVTFSAKSSTTNDVCSVKSSLPCRNI